MDKELKNMLDLPKADVKVFKIICKNDIEYDCDTLSEKLGLNVTTVQRAVKRLYELNLIKRNQTNLSGGGYLFTYSGLDKNDLNSIFSIHLMKKVTRIQKAIDKWCYK